MGFCLKMCIGCRPGLGVVYFFCARAPHDHRLSVPERSEGTEVSKMAIREETVFWEFRGFPGAAWFLEPTAEEFW